MQKTFILGHIMQETYEEHHDIQHQLVMIVNDYGKQVLYNINWPKSFTS